MNDSPQTEIIRVDDIGMTYSSRAGGTTQAIRSVSFAAVQGEFVAVVGPSGCGKSTLIRAIAGLHSPTKGKVLFDGQEVKQVPDGLGVVFQEYSRSLFPWLTVVGNVEFALKHLGRGARQARSTEALERVDLVEFADRYPWQLSGGMQQRVALARALATHPRVMLMDEPFASVDAQTRINLELLTAEISAELGLTTVLITHDIDEAIFLADRVIVLSGRPSRVLTQVEIDLPRPRSEIETKADARFLKYRRKVHELIVSPAKPGDQ